MKFLGLILVLLLIIPIVYSQEYMTVQSQDISLDISSTIDIPSIDNYKFDYLTTELKFVPLNTDRQSLLSLTTRADPFASTNQNKEDISYTWDSLTKDKFEFGYGAQINIQNFMVSVNKKIKFPQEYGTDYIFQTEYIDSRDFEIRKKASDLAEGEDDLYKVVHKIATYVYENVKYDTTYSDTVEKSSWVLANKKGVCDEFAGLFVGLTRSLKIPTKYISGVVFSQKTNDWGPHAWAEVYFPNYGWIPFDPTFGQLGWIDVSHIKLMESEDSKESSVTYNWRSTGAKIKANDLDFDVSFGQSSGKVNPFVILNTKFIEEQVGFGSSVPLEVTLSNPNNFYIPVFLYISKSPSNMDKNYKLLLLEPNEIKKVYWIIEIPNNLDDSLVYSADVEVKTILGASSSAEIKYSSKYKQYRKSKAEEVVSNLQSEEEKVYSSNIDLSCSLGKGAYYKFEKADVTCNVKNSGNKNLDGLSVCLDGKCNYINVGITETNTVKFSFDLMNYEKNELLVTVNGQDISKHVYLNLDLLDVSSAQIINLEHPQEIKYTDSDSVEFSVYSEEKIKDIVLEVYPLDKFYLEELQGSQKIMVNFYGENLDPGNENIVFKLKYNDLEGKEHKIQRTTTINVIEVPWYAKINIIFRKLFRAVF